MFVSQIEISQTENRVQRIPTSTIEQALNYIYQLDGENCSLLTLRHNSEWYMMVGGGPKLFVVTGTEGEILYDVKDPRFYKQNDYIVQVVTGGQLGEFWRSECVSREDLTNIVREYIEKGELNKNYIWSKY